MLLAQNRRTLPGSSSGSSTTSAKPNPKKIFLIPQPMPLKMPKGYSPLVRSTRAIASKAPVKVPKKDTELVDGKMKRVNLKN
jgi:hypothetical protein